MKTITLILTIVVICSYLAITGCDGSKPYRYVTRIESYKPLPGDIMCMYIIDSAEGEITVPVGDTICIECVPMDSVGYGCIYAQYVSPVEGVVYKVREISNCITCPLADGIYLRKYRLRTRD